MSIYTCLRILFFAVSGVGISASAVAASGLVTDQASSSAALDFRVVIPKIFQIVENKHPLALSEPDRLTSRISAQQRLVLVSTLPRGFCMDLQMAGQPLNDWQLHIATGGGAWLQPAPGGYRLCTAKAGRYDVALQHDFSAAGTSGASRQWPVVVSLTTP